MKRKILYAVILLLATVLALASCAGGPEISAITLVPDSIATEYEVGATPDFSTIKVVVTWDDGNAETKEYADLTVGTVDTSVAGKKELSVTYDGFTVKFEITVTDPSNPEPEPEPEPEPFDPTETIYGVALPINLTNRDTYKLGFKVQNEAYVVGDDNAYYFYLDLLKLDDNDEIVTVDGKAEPFRIKVYIKESGSYRELTGTELTSFVAVDTSKNSYDFTEAAVDKSFKLEIRPDTDNVADANAVTRYQEISVVDAYNVYEAWELNIISNADEDLDGTKNSVRLGQRKAVVDYLTVKGIENPAALIESINGVVIHSNLNVGVEDIPGEYFYEYQCVNPDCTEEDKNHKDFYDYLYVYNRNVYYGETFSLYGNYYTVYTYQLPCVVEYGAHPTRSDNIASHGKIFRFRGNNSYSEDPNHVDSTFLMNNFDHENYKVNISNIAFRDDNPNTNDQSASERSMRGLACLNTVWNVTNVYNTNIDAYYVSMVPENDDLTVILDSVKFYNAWQGHLFVWNNNYVAEYWYGDNIQNVPIHPNYQNMKIDIKNSLLAKCGGPVILSQNSKNHNVPCNAQSGVDITVTDSTLYSHVTGQEAWFAAVGQVPLAAKILASSAAIANASDGQASYTSGDKIQGVTTMNMVMVNMGEGLDFSSTGYRGTYTVVKTDGNGNEISRVTALNMTDNTELNNYQNTINTLLGMGYIDPQYIPPIYQSSAGGTFCSDGQSNCFSFNHSTFQQGDVPEGSFEGDFVSMYQMGIGILLEYYHPEVET